MAIENINSDSLSNALNKIDDINSSKLESLRNSLDSQDWDSPVRTRIQDALGKLKNEYDEIKTATQKYKNAINKIQRYNQLDDSNCISNRNKLRNELHKKSSDKEINNIKSMINWYSNKINKINDEKDQLKSEIKSILEG